MEILWYSIVLLIACVYFILDGYDFGVGIIHLFFAKTESEKKLIGKAAGLFWDFNEVWLVVLGGLLFMAFPVYYASVFSGFYLPLMILLWLLIFRAIGIELRNYFQNEVWKNFWDKSFGIASLLLALFAGAALGNIVRGVNMGQIGATGIDYGTQYFFLPLWNENFSPFVLNVGVLDWFTLIIGILSVLILTIHGANWIILKTQSDLIPKLKNLIVILNIAVSVFMIISFLFLPKINAHIIEHYAQSPWTIIFILIFFAGFIIQFFVKKITRPVVSFIGSSAMIFGGITASVVSMFPTILPSNNTVHEGLTIYNTGTTSYGYSIASVWLVFGLILAAVYFIFQKRILNGKIDDLSHEH